MDPYELDVPPSTPLILDGLDHTAYEVSPYYYMTEQEQEMSGLDAHGDGHDAGSRARKFDRIRSKIIRRRSKGRPIPKRLSAAFKKFKPIRPGETRNIPVKLGPHPLIRARGPAGFLQWFRMRHPMIFARMERERPHLIAKAPPFMGGLGAAGDPIESQAPAPKAWWQEVLSFAEGTMVNKHEKEMLEIQVDAAKAGLAPLEIAAPPVEAFRQAAPETKAAIGIGAVIALGAGAFFLLGPGMKMFGRRRRR